MKAPGTKGRSSTFGKAMSRSAEARKCPKCGRKSALVRFRDEWASGSYCRWEDCDFERVRAVGGEQE